MSRGPRGLRKCSVPGCVWLSRFEKCHVHRAQAVAGTHTSLPEVASRVREERELRNDDPLFDFTDEEPR